MQRSGNRARIVEATDAERRRLERDLHDGAQQRLVSLSLALRLIRQRLGAPDSSNEDTIAAVDMAGAELKLAISEVRELARGIHPAILTEAGLGAAIGSLAERSVVPAHVTELPDRRLAATIEATVYFVVSEALTNTPSMRLPSMSSSQRPVQGRGCGSRSATTVSVAPTNPGGPASKGSPTG